MLLSNRAEHNSLHYISTAKALVPAFWHLCPSGFFKEKRRLIPQWPPAFYLKSLKQTLCVVQIAPLTAVPSFLCLCRRVERKCDGGGKKREMWGTWIARVQRDLKVIQRLASRGLRSENNSEWQPERKLLYIAWSDFYLPACHNTKTCIFSKHKSWLCCCLSYTQVQIEQQLFKLSTRLQCSDFYRLLTRGRTHQRFHWLGLTLILTIFFTDWCSTGWDAIVWVNPEELQLKMVNSHG